MAKATATAPKRKAKSSQDKMNENIVLLIKQTAEQNAKQTEILTSMLYKQHRGSISQRAKRASVHILQAGAAIINVD
jgi:hypothetical protein